MAKGNRPSGSGGGGGTSAVANPEYQRLMDKLNQKPDSTLWRGAMIKRSDLYVGDSEVKNSLINQISAQNPGMSVQIDSFIFDTAPNSKGESTVYASYSLSKSDYTGTHDLGTGRARMKARTKSGNGTFQTKVLNM